MTENERFQQVLAALEKMAHDREQPAWKRRRAASVLNKARAVTRTAIDYEQPHRLAGGLALLDSAEHHHQLPGGTIFQ